MSRPVVYDLCTGLHGWLEAFLLEGYRCVGYDIEDMCASLGVPRPVGIEFRLRDIRSIHGSELKDATCIVASPPCQAYSYRAMPWKRAKALPPPDNTLFNECFRIQREANAAVCHCECWRCARGGHCVRCDVQYNTGKPARYIPMVIENVRGAQKWVGRAQWNYGSFYLWGDVPALMPLTLARKVPGFRFDGSGKTFQTASVEGLRGIPHRTAGHWTNPAEHEGVKNGNDWFGSGANCSLQRRASSKSSSRKAASAMIAKIPFVLASHIAKCYYPKHESDSVADRTEVQQVDSLTRTTTT